MSENTGDRLKVGTFRSPIWKNERWRPHTPGGLYRCEKTGVAGRGICKLMKTDEMKIDGGLGAGEPDSQKWLSHVRKWMERSLLVNERRVCRHGADLGSCIP